jgi:hypothetical protein
LWLAISRSSGSTNLVRHYFLSDVMRSVMAVTDRYRSVVERVNYDAWGQPGVQSVDNQRPGVARVINETNALLVVFTEPVLPAFQGVQSGSNIITTLRSLNGAFELRSGGSAIAVSTTFEENAPGYPFGSAFRLRPAQALSGTLTLTVQGGAVQDEWNNTNTTETLSLNASSTNAVLFAGPAPGSTAPMR